MNFSQLEQEIYTFRKEIDSNPSKNWWIKEKYINLGSNNLPIYIIEFSDKIDVLGDDLLDEPLVASNHPFLHFKSISSLQSEVKRMYWQPVEKIELITRLYRFLSMYKENYLQPPGTRSITKGIHRPHPRLRGLCFTYKISSPGHTIIGIGPKKCSEKLGAVTGRVIDDSKNPLNGIQVILNVVKAEKSILFFKQETNKNGEFWFSKIPSGYNLQHFICIEGKQSRNIVIDQKPFGKIQGKIYDAKLNPLILSINFCSPDGEIFKALSDHSGQFITEFLPPFSYNLKVEGFEFYLSFNYSGDTLISGIIKDVYNNPVKKRQVKLKSKGKKIQKTTTDINGFFTFENLYPGEYTLEIPNIESYLSGVGTISGIIKN